MTDYQQELKNIIEHYEDKDKSIIDNQFEYIHTTFDGYLIVPINSKYASYAKKICDEKYIGNLAIYLSEDRNEVIQFLLFGEGYLEEV